MLRKITFRPWGWWQALFQGPGYLAKIINVKKGQQLSLQYHQHRSETWIIASGEGEVFANGIWQKARTGKCIHIPVMGIHRIKARLFSVRGMTNSFCLVLRDSYGLKTTEGYDHRTYKKELCFFTKDW